MFSENLKHNTIVEIFDTDKNGIQTHEQTTHNTTVLGGRAATLEMVFRNGFTPSQHLSLETTLRLKKTEGGADNYENPTSASAMDTTVAADWNDRHISYFCVGNSGINYESPLTMAEPGNYETRLYNMIPFRCVPIANDSTIMTSIERAKYAMRRKEKIGNSWYYTYYLKKFDPGVLHMIDANGVPYTPVDANNAAVNPGSATQHPLQNNAIYTHYKFELLVEPTDFKEYFKVMFGSLNGAKITEFGLCMVNTTAGTAKDGMVTEPNGPTYKEVRNVELYSKIVHAPSYMNIEENGKLIRYSILS